MGIVNSKHIRVSGIVAKLPLMVIATLLLTTLLSSAQIAFSTQPEKTETRKGNKQYNGENYTEAEANYKKALDIKNNMPEATFNLGDALYMQKRYDDAGKQYQLSAQTNTEPKIKESGWYNLGNSYMEQKKWDEAVKAYKNALKINPKDADSRYNLAYANEMIKKGKGGGGQDKKDQKDKKDDKKDKDKDKKDQNQDKKDDKQQQDKQGQDKQANQDQKDKQQQGQKSKLSKEETEKLLQALNNNEQTTAQKMQLKQQKTQRVKIQKDW